MALAIDNIAGIRIEDRYTSNCVCVLPPEILEWLEDNVGDLNYTRKHPFNHVFAFTDYYADGWKVEAGEHSLTPGRYWLHIANENQELQFKLTWL